MPLMLRQHPPKPLYELLLVLFPSNDDLYQLLATYPYKRAARMVAELPGTNVARTTFAMKSVERIQAHGLDEVQLFDELADRFPGRRDFIRAAQHAYLGDPSAPN